MDKIVNELSKMQDKKYADFIFRLMPNIERESIIGVRMPEIRSLLKTLVKENQTFKLFLDEVPHKYYEENMLHSAYIHSLKDIHEVFYELDKFLPYVDNWAVCDTINPKIFVKYPCLVRQKIEKWLKSENIFTQRFGIVTLINCFLDDNFVEQDLTIVANINTDDYYVYIAKAWYFSFALIKQYDVAIKLIEAKTLDKKLQNKSIQKACESYRISDDKKAYLKSLRI